MNMTSQFVPRAAFPTLNSLPKSYFLGHHRAGLTKMKTKLSNVDIIIECRDYRLPFTSRNPLLEESLAGRNRAFIYTKRDLGSSDCASDRERDLLLRQWHEPAPVFFCDHRKRKDIARIINYFKELGNKKLTGAQAMIAGMPNVGKSSLLNALRAVGMNKGKAAATGGQPGITRSIGSSVQVVRGVYLLDSPGVFIPYVPDQGAMLKLALCGCVKDSIISSIILADYLLFRLNLFSPEIYEQYHGPTNDITTLLDAIARKTGRLQKGGVPDIDAAASWFVQRWRDGQLGRFVLDEVTRDALQRMRAVGTERIISISQAHKERKRLLKQRKSQQPTIG